MIKRYSQSSLLVLGLLCAAGCVAHPELTQVAVTGDTSASQDAYDSYTLQASEIKIRSSGSVLTIQNNVIDARNGVIFQIFLDDPFYQRTILNITKRSGTNTISKAGVSVVDGRKDFIQAFGNIATTAIGIVRATGSGGNTQTAALPAAFRIEDLLADDDGYRVSAQHPFPAGNRHAIPNVPQPNDATWLSYAPGIDYQFGPIPYDAVPLSSVVAQDRHGFDGLYLSACREFRLRVRYVASAGRNSGEDTGGDASSASATGKPKGKSGAAAQASHEPEEPITETFLLKVADPAFVTRKLFPNAGSIVSHDNTCSSSTETSNSGDAAPFAGLANALALQAQAIANAVDAKGNTNKGK